ncbi:hypothetical protein DLAC_02521 [Tieghemostelium lacteum]|uniref:Cytochrome P450 family protein n=1 Tax=Tieghemostelium lacteum TaxID=361077 RepID=A0A152A2S3_TIELA|nr:hypothetical protein DLAC_02521 [Tieghemostelium lacteum]|eukprot:KYR00510.1 hypothetical protein DLAC_02521 [Tieghemostelium lacteum]
MFIFISILIFIYLIYNFIQKNRKRVANEVSGPLAFPVIGNLTTLISKTKMPHEILSDLTKKHGLVYRFYMGHYYSLVVTDPEVVREIFVKNFDNFVDRPHIPSLRYAGNDFKGIAMADEEYWRDHKSKIVSAFSNTNIKKVSTILEKTTNDLIAIMSEYERKSEEFSPRIYCQKYTMNIVLRYIFSLEIAMDEDKSGREAKLIQPILDIFQLLSAGGAGDFISFLSPLYDFYLTHFRKEISQINAFVREVVMEHLETIDRENPRDLIDTLILEYDTSKKENIEKIVCFGREIFMASTETTANTLEWFLLILANNKNVQEKIYNELKARMDQNMLKEGECKLTTKDRNSTPYLNAAIKETMRYRVIGPLGLPRIAKDDILVKDIFIPKGTQIFQNFYGLSNSDKFWNEPKTFMPERFLNNSHSDVFIPFSLGPRNCLGMSLALDEMYLSCANIFANFKLSPPNGLPALNESEIWGLALHPHKFSLKLEKR